MRLFKLTPALFVCVLGCRFKDESVKPVVQDTSPKVVEELKGEIEKLEQTVQSSNNATQNSLNGLANVSISKLTERMTGIEAKVDKVVGIESKIDKIVGLEARIDSLQTTLSSDIQATASANISARLDRLESNIQASMDLGARIDKSVQNASAGRDVNMLPQAAVDVIVTTAQTFSGIVATLCGLAATTISVFARNARKRAEARYEAERQERREMFELLTKLVDKTATNA